ncbi:MAG TPA: hypothetical protein ENI33_00960 [Thermoplasmatales archaeon]|nr:hypothetical protein [Thermoplasmatales archaeon]
MTEMEPTIEEWRRLYNAAIKFKRHECWNYMWDSDIFGVQNPETAEIGYCCVMGRNGEHFALAVYKGSEGLDGLLSIFNDEVDATSINALHVQNCLMASFEDRKYLDKRDYEIIKKLGLKFRGRKAWPLFRDYTPGYHPWYLSSKDARFLTIALEQSIEISMRMRGNPDLLTSNDESLYLVRVPYKVEDNIKWKDKWIKPAPIIREIKSIDLMKNPKYRKRLKNIRKDKNQMGTWEIGTFNSPWGVQEGSERPYYPKLIVYVDHDSRMILSFFMAHPINYQEDFIDHFISFLENINFLPRKIVASDVEILALLHPITEELKIELFEADYLEVVEDVRDFLISSG